MASIDKDFCARLLERGLRTSYAPPPDWRGRAEDWNHFADPAFQAFAAQHAIDPETRIEVRFHENDHFGVCHAS